MKSKPARLEKQEPVSVKKILDKDFVIKIKFYVLIILGLLLMCLFCYWIKGPTYGYL